MKLTALSRIPAKEIAMHAAEEPYGFESPDEMGSMATLNSTWWIEEVEKKKEVVPRHP